MDNLSDIDDDDIESMELLDGNYQNYMQWIRPDRFWDTSPSVRVAIVRYILAFESNVYSTVDLLESWLLSVKKKPFASKVIRSTEFHTQQEFFVQIRVEIRYTRGTKDIARAQNKLYSAMGCNNRSISRSMFCCVPSSNLVDCIVRTKPGFILSAPLNNENKFQS